MPLATFVRFRLFFDAGSDSSHATTAAQFTTDLETTNTPSWGQYVQNVFEMKDGSGAFSVRERGLFGTHWINTTGGNLDTTWTTADYAAVESAVATFWSAYGGANAEIRLVEHRWYPFGPGVTKPNPPSRINTLATPIAGSGGTPIPHQNACTVTLRTALRRHWGRFYMPYLKPLDGTGGQLFPTTVDAIATAARTMLVAPGTSQGVVPVVWDRNKHRAYGMTDVEVDSVTDIVRRRRPRSSAYKKIISA